MHQLFFWDALSTTILSLVILTSCIVGRFAYFYLEGDAHKKRFFTSFIFLILCVSGFVCSNYLPLFFIFWLLSNLSLLRMINYNPTCKASRASARYGIYHFALASLCMLGGLALLSLSTSSSSITEINANANSSNTTYLALGLIAISAMIQSAIIPFHRWLLSSMSAPTPVSALMHAGIVNGGGIILTRFASAYLSHSNMMLAIFAVGLFSALLANFWKLVQTDVKRMLTCSTVSQMGMMFMQCGLGLFPAAIAHLFLHGLFKAYLFLNSPSAALQSKRIQAKFHFGKFIQASICGGLASVLFAAISGKSLADGSIVILAVCFMTCTQIAYSFFFTVKKFPLLFSLIFTPICAIIYALNVLVFHSALASLNVHFTQSAHPLHYVGVACLFAAWISLFFPKIFTSNPIFSRFYVYTLNKTRPHPSTVGD